MFYWMSSLLLLINTVGSFTLAGLGARVDAAITGGITLGFIALHWRWRRVLERRLMPIDKVLSDEEVRASRRGLLSPWLVLTAAGALCGFTSLVAGGSAWAVVDSGWAGGPFLATLGAALLALSSYALLRRSRSEAAA
jgi:hypothetical protein